MATTVLHQAQPPATAEAQDLVQVPTNRTGPAPGLRLSEAEALQEIAFGAKNKKYVESNKKPGFFKHDKAVTKQ